MSQKTRYGLYFARATCPSGHRLIKRRLYEVIRRHNSTCPKCGQPVKFVKAVWSLYVHWMNTGATYVALEGNEN